MSAEAIIQAIKELDAPEQERVFDWFEEMRERELARQTEASRLLNMMDAPSTVWHSREEVEKMLSEAD